MKTFGKIDCAGVELNLTQAPYADSKLFGKDRFDGYFAEAIDDKDGLYLVFWNEKTVEEEDDIECCSWEYPTSVFKL